MPTSGSDEQRHHFLDVGLAPYSEVVIWRRRFYVALAAALFTLLALFVTYASRT